MEETILGTLIIQGLTLVGNVAKSILLTIQAGARFVAESATLGVMSAQNTGFIGLIAKGAIYLAQQIATAVAMISGASVVTLGAAAAIALAAGATAYAFLKGNDILSPGDGSSGYGKRTLFGPEGAISLNNKDTVIAGTDLFQKGNDVAMAPAGAMSVSNLTAPKREVTRDPNSGVISAIRDLMQVTGKVNEVSTLKIQ
jgi:molybdopterin-binding protein